MLIHPIEMNCTDDPFYQSHGNSTATIVPWENIVAGVICGFVSTTGLFVNILCTSSLMSIRRIRNPFSILCASLLLADAGILTIFVFWAAPMSLTLSPLSCSFVGRKIGQLSVLFWFSSLYCTLFLSASRLFAISNPTLYRTHFSKRNSLLTVLGGWILASLHTILYWFDGCDFYYDNHKNAWKYSQSTCGQIAEYVLDLGYGAVFFIFIFVLNVLTAWQIRRSSIVFNTGRSVQRENPQGVVEEPQSKNHSQEVPSIQGEPRSLTVPGVPNGVVRNGADQNPQNGTGRQSPVRDEPVAAADLNRASPTITPKGSHSCTTSQPLRNRAELRMFKLSVIHAGIFELMMISFHVLSRLAAGSTLGEFFATTFAWQTSHAANAFLILYYSREARLSWRRLRIWCCCWCHRLSRTSSPASGAKPSMAGDGHSSRF